jgi:NADP-dependent isocitrate dehydrogenase
MPSPFLTPPAPTEPIIMANVPRLVPGWTRPIVVGRHAYGDQYRATDVAIPGPGTLTLTFKPAGGGPETFSHTVHEFEGPGVGLAMYNTEESIKGFAESCFEYALLKVRKEEEAERSACVVLSPSSILHPSIRDHYCPTLDLL